MYSSVWRKKVWSSMDIWRSSMDNLHGRLLTIFLDDFVVPRRLHWLSVVLLSMYTVPSWVILGPNCSDSSGRFLGRTKVGLIFLLPYQLPLCSRGRPGYCCDFRESFAFLWATCREAIGGQAVSIPFPKGLATCHSLNGQRRFSDPVAGAYK